MIMTGSESRGVLELDAALAALRTGTVSMRLAKNNYDVHAAQALRYRIFYDEMSAQPSSEVARLKRDFDVFDEICDHLLVTDSSLGEGEESVIATYRLLRGKVAKSFGRFYTSGEYDISKLKNMPGETL